MSVLLMLVPNCTVLVWLHCTHLALCIQLYPETQFLLGWGVWLSPNRLKPKAGTCSKNEMMLTLDVLE